MELPVDLVVLDFDGTVCDSADVKTEAFYRLYLADEGPEFAARVRDHHRAHMGISRYDKIRHYEEVLLGRPCDAARLEEMASRFSAIVTEQVIAAPLIAGAREFLDRHSARVPVCVASATPTDELRHIVAAKGLGGYFAAVEGSPAPKGEIVAGFVERFGVASERAVMVGDQQSDFDAARHAGTRFVGVRKPGEDRLFPERWPVIPDLTGLAASLGERRPSRG